jgi:hypothetical protein
MAGAACLALAAGASTATAAPTWLPPTDIAGPTESITFPELAVNEAGDAVAIWPRDIGSEMVLETLERPAGGDWSEPAVLSDPGEEMPTGVDIGLDAAGNAVALWSVDAGSAVRTAVRPAGGDWSAPEDLSVLNGRTPQLAMNAAGDAVAVWTGFDGVDDEVTWAAVRPAGGDWSAPEQLPVEDEVDGFFPQVAIDASGNAIVVWQRFDLSDDVVQAAVRTAGGDWSAPDVLSAPAENARSPRIAMNAAGDAVAAWTVFSGGGIRAAVRSAGGDWSAPEEVSAAGVEPELAVDSNGSAFALWPGPGDTEQVLRTAMRPPGDEWSAPEDLSAEFEGFRSHDLYASPAAGVIATWTWEQPPPEENGIEAAVRSLGSDWSAPEGISTEGENSGLPDLGFDALGNAIAIWGREASSNEYFLQGSGYDFVGPRLDDVRIPATGSVAKPVSFSVSPFDVFSLGATSWAFGDGSPAAQGNAVSHVYSAPGTFPVTVTSTDGSGNRSSRTATIAISAVVAPTPPPPPPPLRIALSLRIEGKSLRSLLRSGVLRVATKVDGSARVALNGGARLRLRSRGKARTRFARIFRRKTVRFAAAGRRKVRLALSRRGRAALRNRSRARIVVFGRARADTGSVAHKRIARTLRR